MRERGHGSGFLRVLAERLLADGATAVAIDPAADNRSAPLPVPVSGASPSPWRPRGALP